MLVRGVFKAGETLPVATERQEEGRLSARRPEHSRSSSILTPKVDSQCLHQKRNQETVVYSDAEALTRHRFPFQKAAEGNVTREDDAKKMAWGHTCLQFPLSAFTCNLSRFIAVMTSPRCAMRHAPL